MATIEYKRIVNKSGDGPATVPPSPSHDTGDWIETDIYENELYMDNLTGFLYTNIAGVIVQLDAGAVPPASETEAGIAEIATQAETNAGVDDARIVTPLKLATWWTNIKTLAATISGIWTFKSEKIRVETAGALWWTALKSLATANQNWSIPDEGDQTFASQTYVQNLLAGLKWKASVKVATTASGTLATDFENGDTIDGVVLVTGDRILIKNQAGASAVENGIYIVNASGAPTRATDADTGLELVMAVVPVEQGTVNQDKAFACTNNAITLGVTNIVFTGFAVLMGALLAANNLSDVASPSTSFDNIKQSATETYTGVAEIATQAETNTGTDDVRFITALKLATWWTAIKGSAANITGAWNFSYGKLGLFNAAGTFATLFQTQASVGRTVIFPDKDMTVAGTDDIAAVLGVYRRIAIGGVRLITGTVAGTYGSAGQQNSAITSGAVVTLPLQFINASALTADMPTINGLNPKLRLRATVSTNGTAPTGTYRWALFAVTGVGGVGAGIAYTIGAEEAGSTTPTVSAPGASTNTNVVGSDFAVPAAGLYCLCLVKTGTIAVGAEVHSQVFLQSHYA